VHLKSEKLSQRDRMMIPCTVTRAVGAGEAVRLLVKALRIIIII